jgi:hypothetical protein
MNNSNIQEIYDVKPNDKFFYRNFNFSKLNESQECLIESNPTIFIALLNICSENLKKGEWADENLNQSKTNIEALLKIVNSIVVENSTNKTFDKVGIYNFFDKNVNYLGDESVVSSDISSLAKKILSVNTAGKPSHICSVFMKLLTLVDEQYSSYFNKDSSAVKNRFGKLLTFN